MFVNELLKEKLCLEKENEEHCLSELEGTKSNEEVDFTFDHYIPQENCSEEPVKSEDEDLEHSEENVNNEQTKEESTELRLLKSHIFNLESIAMKEISELKEQLKKEMNEKEEIKQKLEQMERSFKNEVKNEESCKMLALLKDENKILKDALKKQLQINKNLIKDTMITKESQNFNSSAVLTENSETKEDEQENDKENNSLTINSTEIFDVNSKEKLRMLFTDRPSIPLPVSNRKILRV